MTRLNDASVNLGRFPRALIFMFVMNHCIVKNHSFWTPPARVRITPLLRASSNIYYMIICKCCGTVIPDPKAI